MDAASFCMKIVGNKIIALKHLEAAEQLKNLIADLKLQGTVDQSKLTP